MAEADLKQKTAKTLKWNTIDKFATQLLYAVTGVVLANILSKEDFGLVGIMLAFQAFASLFVDSGFSAALIQKESPTDRDYSTVFYFNLGVSVFIYAILWICAPLIADYYHDERLTSLSRVMFLAFIINATALVQTNRLMKQMTVAKIAVSNSVGLIVSGIVSIILAVKGFGAWAIVWQTITLAVVKSAFLWLTTHWFPQTGFSLSSLKSVFSVGMGVMASSFLNTISLNIYSFVIGKACNLSALGCYTQADKWSKMGVTSISQILTNSFLPILSGFQGDKERFVRAARKMNRFSSYLTFPSMLLLIALAEPIFHILFGTKWDEAIILFQILAARGIFVVLTSLYNQYILALGKSKALVWYEIIKDVMMIVAIVVTVPFGVETIVWGQFAASAVFYTFALPFTSHHTGYPMWRLVGDALPYAAVAIGAAVAALSIGNWVENAWLKLIAVLVAFVPIYIIIIQLLGSKVQQEILEYLRRK